MSEARLRRELTEYARRAYDRGLVGGTGGNFSARLDAKRMLITASGVSLADTTVENLVSVDLDTHGWPTSKGGAKPSKELLFHAEILRRRPEVGAVLHCHPPHATAYAVARRDIPMLTDAAFKQPPIPRVPFAPSGTEALRDNVARALEGDSQCRVLLLEEHGVIALGANVVAAYDTADLIEELARIAYLARGLGAGDGMDGTR